MLFLTHSSHILMNISSDGSGRPRKRAERAMRAAFFSGRNMMMLPSFCRKTFRPSKQEMA